MSGGGIWAVVPVKTLDEAKQRLAAAFSPALRRALVLAMLTDVLTALAAAEGLDGILVASADAEVAALAGSFGAVVDDDAATGGLTAAVTHAGRRLAAEGRAAMLVLPGDVPGVTAAEIGALVDAHRAGSAVVIVPAHDRRGTNAMLVAPPDAIRFAFGRDSFLPHVAAARQAGLSPLVLPLPGIGLDCDHPGDVAQFARRASDTATFRLLAAEGLAPSAAPRG